MKNRVFATFSCVTLLTAAAAFGQTNAVMGVDIPFEFHAGATALPAGHYEVTPEPDRNVLMIRCIACKAAALIQVNAVEAGKAAETGSLVFNQYNGARFLAKVWTPGRTVGQELPKSKAERELARNGSPGPSVILAAIVQR